MFSKNVGPVDRVVRIAIGLGALSLFFFGPHTPWGLIGIVPLATSFAGTCPLYSVFGIRTCKV